MPLDVANLEKMIDTYAEYCYNLAQLCATGLHLASKGGRTIYEQFFALKETPFSVQPD